MLIALQVDLVRLPTTPLQMLVVTLGLSLIGVLVIGGTAQVLSSQVDKRWPATEPLDPTELLWAEMGGYVQSHFKGLDLDLARDIASEMVPMKVPAGAAIVEQGEPAAFFYVLKDGQAEVVQRVDGGELSVRKYDAGASFGEVAILRRSARTATVRAITDCTVLTLPAEDFLAATALSAAGDNPLLTAVDRYLADDRARQGGGVERPSRRARRPMAAPVSWPAEADAEVESPEPEAPTKRGRGRRFPATHRVAAGGAVLHDAAQGGTQTGRLQAGEAARVLERFGGRAHVQVASGSQGWVDETTIQAM